MADSEAWGDIGNPTKSGTYALESEVYNENREDIKQLPNKERFEKAFYVMASTLGVAKTGKEDVKVGWWTAIGKYPIEDIEECFIILVKEWEGTYHPKPSDAISILNTLKNKSHASEESVYGSDWDYLNMPPQDLQFYGHKLIKEKSKEYALNKLKKAGLNGFRPYSESPMAGKLDECLERLSESKTFIALPKDDGKW